MRQTAFTSCCWPSSGWVWAARAPCPASPPLLRARRILYKDASLKGRVVTTKEMCTWFPGNSEGCVAWTLDEWYQSQYCGLPDFPWSGAALTSYSADDFATEPWNGDTTGHECHTAGAVRHVLLR